MNKILIVDDKESYASMLAEALRLKGYETVLELNSSNVLETAKVEAVDLVISDYVMSPINGLEVLRILKAWDETLPVILITDKAHQPEVVIEAEKVGCMDFLSKATGNGGLVDFDELYTKVAQGLKFRKLLCENQRLKNQFCIDHVIGASAQMEEVFSLIQKVAPTDCTVLINGESGVGKELVAHALHQLSPRNNHTMVAINCGGMPEHLLESELFGHKRGAFTNAFTDKRGLFEEANHGTLFLDEIATLPMTLQAKLLRTLQEREIRRVGENTTIKVDVRIIAATNQSLNEMIKKGSFREDLFYRLSVIPIDVPSLRQRPTDIPLLVAHFIKHSHVKRGVDQEIRIEPEALDLLCSYEWPGNVRELQNVIERALVLCDGRMIRVGDLPAKLRGGGDAGSGTSLLVEHPNAELLSLEHVVSQVEWEHCHRALKRFNGDKKKAAEALKISLPAIYRKLKAPQMGEEERV